MNYRKTKLYRTMTAYIACSIVEGFSEEDHTEVEVLTAWQWLVDTGLCWRLQGWYGRTAYALVTNGVIAKPTTVHYDSYGNPVKF